MLQKREQAPKCGSNEEEKIYIYLLWNLKFRYVVHKNTPFFSTLNQINPVHILSFYVFNIKVNLAPLFLTSAID
jgi:hypothetical protein